MKRSALLLLLLTSLTCVAQVGVDPDLQSAVNAGNQAWSDGMRRADGSVIAATYAPDAVNCTADGQCVSGINAIASQLRSRLASYGRAQTANVSTTSLVRDRDLAYEWGYADAVFGGGRNIRGRYLTVWQRQPRGGWKILRNMTLPGGREGGDRRPPRDMDMPPRREQASTVRCESDDMGRHSCALPYQVNRAVLQRQISGAQCVQGTTWGWSSNAVWVDRGCRADFTVYGFVNDAAPEQRVDEPVTEYNAREITQNLRCESNGESYKFCAADGGVRRARMVRQLSGSPCTETKTWGWKSDGIWVDKGCRAEFEVVMR